MIEVQAPKKIPPKAPSYSIFLGGSIEMGKAERWQDRIVEDLVEYDVTVLNPRRDDWDASWIQDPTPGTQFHEQVTWEMDMQEEASLIVYYFAPFTISPITLLELGTYHGKKPTIVCCSPEYERYGNVKILCDYYNIPIVDNYHDLLAYVEEKVSTSEIGFRALRTPMDENDARADTIGEYLIRLSHECWISTEGFSGKRPFGNSGWTHELVIAICKEFTRETKAKFHTYEDGYEELNSYDHAAVNDIINMAYQALYNMVSNENSNPK